LTNFKVLLPSRGTDCPTLLLEVSSPPLPRKILVDPVSLSIKGPPTAPVASIPVDILLFARFLLLMLATVMSQGSGRQEIASPQKRHTKSSQLPLGETDFVRVRLEDSTSVEELDLGTILTTTTRHIDLELVNESDDTITLDGIDRSCGCTDVKIAAKSLSPKETVRGSLQFSSNAPNSKKQSSVTFRWRTNAGLELHSTVKLRATVIPEVEVVPKSLDIAISENTDSNRAIPIEILNNGIEPWAGLTLQVPEDLQLEVSVPQRMSAKNADLWRFAARSPAGIEGQGKILVMSGAKCIATIPVTCSRQRDISVSPDKVSISGNSSKKSKSIYVRLTNSARNSAVLVKSNEELRSRLIVMAPEKINPGLWRIDLLPTQTANVAPEWFRSKLIISLEDGSHESAVDVIVF
jgi:hypothetical protein